MAFCKLYFDGACKSNPSNIASIGFVIYDGIKKHKYGGMLEQDVTHTNNQAEYIALIYGMKEALKLKFSKIDIYGDSQLVIKQLNGEYKVKEEKLKELYKIARYYAKQFDGISFNHIPREQNSEADEMANIAIKKLKN